MAAVLNEMVSIYPPEVLYPQIAAIDDPAVKERQYKQYLMETFYKHAEGDMVQYGGHFREYGDYYKRELLQMTWSSTAVGSVETL